jgi:hypothetical protein
LVVLTSSTQPTPSFFPTQSSFQSCFSQINPINDKNKLYISGIERTSANITVGTSTSIIYDYNWTYVDFDEPNSDTVLVEIYSQIQGTVGVCVKFENLQGNNQVYSLPYTVTVVQGCQLIWVTKAYLYHCNSETFVTGQIVGAIWGYHPKPSYAPNHIPPTMIPTIYPTYNPSKLPIVNPSIEPSSSPSQYPSILPSQYPTISPSIEPSSSPSQYPSILPSQYPTISPSIEPSSSPSQYPSILPSQYPTTRTPTLSPIQKPPTISNSEHPSSPNQVKTVTPSTLPLSLATLSPSVDPTIQNENYMSVKPSLSTFRPISTNTGSPSAAAVTESMPSRAPVVSSPSLSPSAAPVSSPTEAYTSNPSTRDASTAPSSQEPVFSGSRRSSSWGVTGGLIGGLVAGGLVCVCVGIAAYYGAKAAKIRREEHVDLKEWISQDAGGEVQVAEASIIVLDERRRSRMLSWENSYRSFDVFSDNNPLEARPVRV